MDDMIADERDPGTRQKASEARGQRELLERWNNQKPHLTALEALERHGWSVFPLDQSKNPPTTGGLHPDGTPKRLAWRVYQMQRASRDTLLAWTQRFDPAAWAVITGAGSGVIVLDFDGSEGARLLERLGLAPHVRTGSGGYHVYFAHPGWPVKTLNGKTARALGQRWAGLDIRADGGYAAFCGHNSQGSYVWLREPLPEPLDGLPTDMRHFFGLLHAPAPLQARQAAVLETGQQRPSSPAAGLLEQALARGAREGRNNAGFWLACRLRDAGLSEAEASITMTAYAQRVSPRNSKGQEEAYTEQEALASLKSAYRHESPRATSFPLHAAPFLHPDPKAELDTVLDAYRKDEWGDALLFAHLFEGRCVFDHLEKAWYLWQDHFWKRDEMGRVRQLVSGPLASVYLQAAADLTARLGESDGADTAHLHQEQEARQREKDQLQKLIKGLTGRAFALRTLARNSHVLAFACTDGRLALTSERWDTNP